MNRSIFSVLLALASALTVSPSEVEAADRTASRIDVITLESISGYSQPRFTLTIRGDGTVRYCGKNFVNVTGTRTSKISRHEFDRLVQKIWKIDFFHLEDKYGSVEIGGETIVVTDQPMQIVTVRGEDRTKKVEDYMGAPKRLRELEDLIADTVSLARWVGPDSDRDIPYYDAFPLNQRVRFRGLLQGGFDSLKSTRPSSYMLMLVKNGLTFDLRAERSLDLSKFDGYIVDVIGFLRQERRKGPVLVASEIRRVRRYVESAEPKKSRLCAR